MRRNRKKKMAVTSEWPSTCADKSHRPWWGEKCWLWETGWSLGDGQKPAGLSS